MNPAANLADPQLKSPFTLAVSGLLAVLTLALHGSALYGDWRIDDASVLWFVIEHPEATGYFFSPQQWQATGVPFFTPWLILDYWLDFSLFGLNPQGFYAHHLFLVWLAALLTFVLLLRPAGPVWAGAAALLFLLGAPVAVVSQQLQARHYATGLVLAIPAIIFWLQARRTGSRSALGLSGAFYLAAMLNKEIFAPLPLVLFFLGGGSLKDRLRAMLPLSLAAALFVTWRAIMLGKLIGGYGNSFHEAGQIATSLAGLPGVFFGAGGPMLAGGLVLLWAAALTLRSSRLAGFAAMCAAALALSLPFLAIRLTPEVMYLRFAFLPWWGACVLLALGFGSGRSGGGRLARLGIPAGALLFLVVTATKHIDTAGDHAALAAEFDVQGRFLREHDDRSSYVPSGTLLSVFHFQQAVTALKKISPGQTAPTAFPFMEGARLLATTPVFSYDAGCRCMRQADGGAAPPARRTALPMEVALQRPDNTLAWQFGVPADAACFLRFPALNTTFWLPCTGRIANRPPAWLQGSFQFFARTPAGAWDVSPPLPFPEAGGEMRWRSAPAGNPRPTP